MNPYMRIGKLIAEAKKAKETPLERAYHRIEPASQRRKRTGMDYNDPKFYTPKENKIISDYSRELGKGGGMSYEPDSPYTSDETKDPSTKKGSKKRR